MSDLYMSYKILESNEMHFKTCTKCGETLPATTEYFHKQKNGKYGLKSKCKKCIAEYHKNNRDKILEQKKQYYEDNKEKILEQRKQYRENNKDKTRQYRENNKDYYKQYYEDNKEKIREQKKQYYEDNRDKELERFKQWREANRYKVTEYKKQYYATPQGKVVAFNGNYRRRTKEQNQGNGITSEQWLDCMKFFNWKCAYSGQALSKGTRSLDHIKPLNRSGEHEIWNVVPMDRGLNSSKNDKDLLEWYQEQDFYSEERLQKIYEWQEYAYNKYSKK